MDSKRFIKKVAAISTLAVFAFTAIPQPDAGAAVPSTQVSKQQRTDSVRQAMEQKALEEEAQKRFGALDDNAVMLAPNGEFSAPGDVPGDWFEHLPAGQRTPALSLKAVQENGLMLTEVPPSAMSEEICLEAVKNAPGILRDVPKKFMTREVCFEAVSRQGNLLRFVPQPLRTLETCQAAVKNDGDALAYVPDHFKNPTLCMLAVQTSKMGSALDYVPLQLKTKEMCFEAIKRHSLAFNFVPPSLKDSEIYALTLAVAQTKGQDGMVEWLQTQIPNNLKTEVLLKAAKINIAEATPKRTSSFVPQKQPLQ